MTLGIPEWWLGLGGGRGKRKGEDRNKMDAGMRGKEKQEGQTEGKSEIN